jgi:hypothetical protein
MGLIILLSLIDPVRGEPTVHGLDFQSSETETDRERFLKCKFLDSFALICATKKDGESVSAACIEEAQPYGTVIRIANNAGVRESILSQLRVVVHILG